MEVDPFAPLRHRVGAAAQASFGADGAAADPALHRSQHADYQADIALALARKLKRNPREVATAIVAGLPPDDVIEKAEVSGPGFINLTLRPDFIAALLGRMLASERLGVAQSARPETVVVDYSSPNLAKEMHVGHLRSTIIGDALVRVLELQGHRVLRQNHIGDWGTPFGMLLEELIDLSEGAPLGKEGRQHGLGELVVIYKEARRKFDADPAFAERARRRVVLLQGGDAETLALWRQLIDLSVAYCTTLYQRLGVSLGPEHVAGESMYNAALPGVVAELERLGLARESEGAICVFLDGFTGREGELVPLIVRKQDGGYTYATTDLAAVRHRVGTLGASRVIVVVGATQSQHLAMVFATARLARWVGEGVRLEHVAFGSVLGPDKKMFKTRAGETVSLAALVDEGIERATKVVADKSPELAPEEQRRIAEAVAVGAIKYADLSSDRIKDYVFDWNRMLAFDGNTAPYLQYAHARICSIFRRAGIEPPRGVRAVSVGEPAERALALELLGFSTVCTEVAESLELQALAGYLFTLATVFTAFYERCPVLRSEGETRRSRLVLCDLTAQVLERGLGLLGIAAPPRM